MIIKTFGKISEIVTKEFNVKFPTTIVQLKNELEAEFPLLKTINYSIAIDDKLISDENYSIDYAQSIALMPPFSGG